MAPNNLHIAVYGAGGIGSTVAFHLSKANHRVTVIARNQRLAQLEAIQAIEKDSGERAPIEATNELDPNVQFDLIVVTVLHPQLAAILPALKASKAKQIMTFFNIFDPLSTLSKELGADRFVPGFPAINAGVDSATGRLRSQTVGWPLASITTDSRWATVFSSAGIPMHVEAHPEAWLKTHSVLMAVLLSALGDAAHRRTALTWSQSSSYGTAVNESYDVVRATGFDVYPTWIAYIRGTFFAVLVWIATHFAFVRTFGSGASPQTEAAALVQQVIVAAKQHRVAIPHFESMNKEHND